jgi:rSAM/selenodomain-associated transferase 1/rSAM/selenodomain-associated transferase 2
MDVIAKIKYMLKYSFIIPTYNEELYIKQNIHLLKLLGNDIEIIIVDGGSNDETVKIAKEEKVKIISCKTGRGIQFNSGAEIATGNILCFLHADTFLPADTIKVLNNFFNNSANTICRFRLGFDIEHWLLDKYTYFSKYDTIFSRFGDMFIAVRKNFFTELNGFPNWKTFEDVDFLKRASKKEKVVVLNRQVLSSARAFVKFGLINQQIFNGYLITKYLLGFRKFISENIYYKRESNLKKTSLIVFVRYPWKGKVKTRLAATIGDKKACSVYKIIAENIINEIKQIPNCNKYIFYSVKKEKELIKKWLGKDFYYVNQEGKDLGERMRNAFRIVFGHGAKKVIILGTDIPNLSTANLTNAIKALEKTETVVGPSIDGGFYLLGMKKFYPQLFEDIQYSTNTVLEETIQKIKFSHLSFDLLERLQDIDTEYDLKNCLKEMTDEKLKVKLEEVYTTK